MLNQLDNFYFSKPEPAQSAFLFLRNFILEFNAAISEHYKYSTAFFHYKGKALCYFSVRKKDQQAYIGFVNGYLMKHKSLAAENRSQIKVYYFNPAIDLDVDTVKQLLKLAVNTYK